MSTKRSTYVMSGDSFFEPGVPIYVNRAQEAFEMHTHSHEFIEITYISEGSGVHYIGDESVSVEQGTLIFIPIGLSHVFRPKTPKKDSPLIVYNCLFPLEYLYELRSGFPQASEMIDFFTNEKLSWYSAKDSKGIYNSMFYEMYHEFSARPPGYFAVMTSLVIRMLTGLYRHQIQINMPVKDMPQWMAVDKAIDYINRNYESELKLREIAAKANLSERQFSRLFQRQTGMNFINYIQNIRMEAACRLLVTNHCSVTEISVAVGYTDLKFFHQLFKKKTGSTPRQYRATARIDQIQE
ncbi:helix-turn-helix domain-containing protein [Paenibacillus illinoisensis]|uniref:Helix-turn-helix domain-containing protein n=1 Tax=Paenibacillus illinoisensis TaxID=59845 RepID=A0ABW8HQW0_9BACL